MTDIIPPIDTPISDGLAWYCQQDSLSEFKMALRQTKPALASLTIISAGVAVLAQGVKLAFGYTITPADQAIIVSYGQQAVEIGTTIATLAGGLGAIWGRVRATKQITTKKLVP
jgi:hypothetical protein